MKDTLRVFVLNARRCTRTQFGSEGSHGMRLVDIFLISPVGDNLGLEPSIFGDFVRNVTNVSMNHEDY